MAFLLGRFGLRDRFGFRDDGFARRAFLQGSLAVGGAAGLTLAPGIFDSLAAASTPLPTTQAVVPSFP